MSEKRFQKTRIVDKWGGIYDSETDKVLNVNDVEHKLNEQQSNINKLKEAIKIAYEEKPYPKIEDIMTIYSKLEKEIDV